MNRNIQGINRKNHLSITIHPLKITIHPNKIITPKNQLYNDINLFIILSVGVSLLFVITIIFNQSPYSCLISIINFIVSLNLICGVIIDRSQ